MTALLAAFFGSLITSGLALAGQLGRRLTGTATIATGALLGAAALLARSHHDLSELCIFIAISGPAPIAVLSYPTAPTGRRRWLTVAATVLAGASAALAAIDQLSLAMSLATALWLTVSADLWWRLERHPEERRPLLWLSFALLGAFVVWVIMVFSLTSNDEPGWWTAGVFLLVGPAAWLGTRPSQRFDVRALVSSFVVTCTGVITLLAATTATVGFVEIAAGQPVRQPTVLLIAAISAVAYHPFTTLLRGSIDQVLFGRRPDPTAAVETATRDPSASAPEAIDQLRRALLLPFLELNAPDHPSLAAGTRPEHVQALIVQLSPTATATLTVGLRPGDLRLSLTEADVLALATKFLLARLAAETLAVEVASARVRLNMAVAEERRRLRRDLHDGLGPHLTGLAYSADAALNQLPHPHPARPAVLDIRSDATVMIEDIRKLVAGLRPRAIDERGLVGAWRELAQRLRTSHGVALSLALRGTPTQLRTLPAHVEVAAYWIVAEALANVAKHGDSPRARVVWLVSEQALHFRVTNSSTKLPTGTGVGLTSMRQRAEECGGSVRVERSATRWGVHAVLPLALPPELAPSRTP